MVDVIELDDVVPRQRLAVAPRPADRDAGVPEAANLVVRDQILRRLAEPDADRAGDVMPQSAIVQSETSFIFVCSVSASRIWFLPA